MLLFEKEYNKFFNPLSCKNKKIYYECILQLIEKSKEVPILYENDARDTLILYFRNLAYAVEDENIGEKIDANISSKKSETENASAVLSYFRSCNWILEHELGRNGDNIATVTPYCRRIIDAIERIFNRENSASLTNHIFSIYDILSSASNAEHGRNIRPYSNILAPVVENVSDLKNELLVLKDNIHSIMQIVIKITETNELGQFLVKDEMMESFFNDYFFIKKDGLIPGYIAEIERMLRRIAKTEIYYKMIEEYVKLNSVEENKAREIIDGQLSEIKGFISFDYVKEMAYIDQKINSYYNLYSTRILMVLSNNVNMQNHLNNLLLSMKNMDSNNREQALNKLSKYFTIENYKYIGRKSIERRKKRRPNTKSGAIVCSTLSNKEREEQTNALLYGYTDRYGEKEASDYFDSVIGNRDAIVIDDKIIQTRDDAMMVAASIIYSDSLDFPYEVEFLGGVIETEIATISNVRIKRKKYE